MSTAIGGFNWSPEQFWRATPSEYYAACEYHALVKKLRDQAQKNR